MCGIEQAVLAQPRESVAPSIRGDDGVPERILVEALLHHPKGVAALCRLGRRGEVDAVGKAERDARLERCRIPPGNEGRDYSLVLARRDAQEIDDGNLVLVSLAQPSVVGGSRVGAHKGVVDGFLALVDLPVRVPLVVVPDLSTASRYDGLDRQEEAHLPRCGFMRGMRPPWKSKPGFNSAAVNWPRTSVSLLTRSKAARRIRLS